MTTQYPRNKRSWAVVYVNGATRSFDRLCDAKEYAKLCLSGTQIIEYRGPDCVAVVLYTWVKDKLIKA
jgi:hypothetical protein